LWPSNGRFPNWRWRHNVERSGGAIATAETKTRRMSAAARKAVSARTKKYWAERRKAKAKVK
jgi:hypothetical protein